MTIEQVTKQVTVSCPSLIPWRRCNSSAWGLVAAIRTRASCHQKWVRCCALWSREGRRHRTPSRHSRRRRNTTRRLSARNTASTNRLAKMFSLRVPAACSDTQSNLVCEWRTPPSHAFLTTLPARCRPVKCVIRSNENQIIVIESQREKYITNLTFEGCIK